MFTSGTIITQMHHAGQQISIQRSHFCPHILKKSRVQEWAFNQQKKLKSFVIVSTRPFLRYINDEFNYRR